jgi:hypothetical protein
MNITDLKTGSSISFFSKDIAFVERYSEPVFVEKIVTKSFLFISLEKTEKTNILAYGEVVLRDGTFFQIGEDDFHVISLYINSKDVAEFEKA